MILVAYSDDEDLVVIPDATRWSSYSLRGPLPSMNILEGFSFLYCFQLTFIFVIFRCNHSSLCPFPQWEIMFAFYNSRKGQLSVHLSFNETDGGIGRSYPVLIYYLVFDYKR